MTSINNTPLKQTSIPVSTTRDKGKEKVRNNLRSSRTELKVSSVINNSIRNNFEASSSQRSWKYATLTRKQLGHQDSDENFESDTNDLVHLHSETSSPNQPILQTSVSNACGSWKYATFRRILLEIPPELQLHIFSYLPIKTLFILRQVCRQLFGVVQQTIMDRAIEYGCSFEEEKITLDQQRVHDQFNLAYKQIQNLVAGIRFFVSKKLIIYDNEKINIEETLKRLQHCSFQEIIKIFVNLLSSSAVSDVYLNFYRYAGEKENNKSIVDREVSKTFLSYLFQHLSTANFNIRFDDTTILDEALTQFVTRNPYNQTSDIFSELFFESIKTNFPEIIQFLFLHVTDLDKKISINKGFYIAIQCRYYALAGSFLTYFKNLDKKTLDGLLLIAVDFCPDQHVLIQRLLNMGADASQTNQAGSFGDTLLHNLLDDFTWESRRRKVFTWNQNVQKTFEILLDAQPDLLLKGNKYGAIPLHYACDSLTKLPAILFFLQKGVDPNTTNNYGWAPLHTAMEYCNPSAAHEIVQHLLQYGAHLNLHTSDNLSAFDYMIIFNQAKVAKFLIEKELIDPNQLISDAILWRSFDTLKIILNDKRTNINQTNGDGFSPLGLAEYLQSIKQDDDYAPIVELLSKKGVKSIKPSKSKLKELKDRLLNRSDLPRNYRRP